MRPARARLAEVVAEGGGPDHGKDERRHPGAAYSRTLVDQGSLRGQAERPCRAEGDGSTEEAAGCRPESQHGELGAEARSGDRNLRRAPRQTGEGQCQTTAAQERGTV